MNAKPCPPFAIDQSVDELLQRYRGAKHGAANAAAERRKIETAGHYDRDGTVPRAIVESEAAVHERAAAIALADALLSWVDGH